MYADNVAKFEIIHIHLKAPDSVHAAFRNFWM